MPKHFLNKIVLLCVLFSLFCFLKNATIFIEKVRLNDQDTIFLEFFPSRNSIEIENKGFKRTWNMAKIKSWSSIRLYFYAFRTIKESEQYLVDNNNNCWWKQYIIYIYR